MQLTLLQKGKARKPVSKQSATAGETHISTDYF